MLKSSRYNSKVVVRGESSYLAILHPASTEEVTDSGRILEPKCPTPLNS
ncbi:MAG: hypothetical protein P8X89_19865 [Reinekea sp.]